MCTGWGIVLPWPRSALLYPARYSNLSPAFIRPMFPSWMRSRNCSPRLVYFLAIDTTRRRFASTSSRFASRTLRSPCSITRSVSVRVPALPDPPFRLLDRVGVPADLVADDLDLPLLQVDFPDRVLHPSVEGGDLLLSL